MSIERILWDILKCGLFRVNPTISIQHTIDYSQSTLVKGPPIFPLLGLRIQR